MFKKQDAAQAAGVSAPQKEKAPSAKTEGSKKNPHFIERLQRRLAAFWWVDVGCVAALLAFVAYLIIGRLAGVAT